MFKTVVSYTQMFFELLSIVGFVAYLWIFIILIS